MSKHLLVSSILNVRIIFVTYDCQQVFGFWSAIWRRLFKLWEILTSFFNVFWDFVDICTSNYLPVRAGVLEKIPSVLRREDPPHTARTLHHIRWNIPAGPLTEMLLLSINCDAGQEQDLPFSRHLLDWRIKWLIGILKLIVRLINMLAASVVENH